MCVFLKMGDQRKTNFDYFYLFILLLLVALYSGNWASFYHIYTFSHDYLVFEFLKAQLKAFSYTVLSIVLSEMCICMWF